MRFWMKSNSRRSFLLRHSKLNKFGSSFSLNWNSKEGIRTALESRSSEMLPIPPVNSSTLVTTTNDKIESKTQHPKCDEVTSSELQSLQGRLSPHTNQNQSRLSADSIRSVPLSELRAQAAGRLTDDELPDDVKLKYELEKEMNNKKNKLRRPGETLENRFVYAWMLFLDVGCK